MNEASDIARLERWRLNDVIPEDRIAEVVAHPMFSAAARTLSTRMLQAAAADKALDGMVKDVGRYTATNWAVQLHVSGGLTLPGLKQVCEASGLVSPGRARAILLYLQYLGYVKVAGPAARNAPTLYTPTPALMQAWRASMTISLEAASLIEPAAALILARLDEPAVLDAFVSIQGEGLSRVASSEAGEAGQAELFTQIFLHRHGGMQLIHWFVQTDEQAFPPRRTPPISATALARRLTVSRVHLRRLLNNAERKGLIGWEDDGCLLILPPLRRMIEWVFANRLIGFLILAAKTADRVPRSRSGAL